MKSSLDRVNEVALSPDGRLVVGASAEGLMLWKVADLRRGNSRFQLLLKAKEVAVDEAGRPLSSGD